MKKNLKKAFLILPIVFFIKLYPSKVVNALEINISGTDDLSSSIDVFLMITMISFLPAILITMTCYVQIIMVLSLARQALGTATTPPNMVLSGMAIILTLFIMNPVLSEINEKAYQPYKEGGLTLAEAVEEAEMPLKLYLVNNSNENYIKMYAKISGTEDKINSRETVPFLVASAANVTTQVTKALGIGAVLMVCFIVIDMIVATILMLLGMFMLPPQMISLPIKILTFLSAGGFSMLIEIIMQGIKT